jgi:hypothetical protein
VPGYPIRKPSDHSSVDSSPRHIAASHVLHRSLMPRHPPYALNNLHHKHNTTIKHKNRCSHPLYNSQTPTRQPNHINPPGLTQQQNRFGSGQVPEPSQHTSRVLSQDPTACRHISHPTTPQLPFHAHPQKGGSTSKPSSHQTVTHPVVPQSTEQPPPQTIAAAGWRLHQPHRVGGVLCSLERR